MVMSKRWPCDTPYCGGQYFFEFRPARGGPALEEIHCSLCGYPPGGRAAFEAKAERLRATIPLLEEETRSCAGCGAAVVGDDSTVSDGREYCGPCTEIAAFPSSTGRRRRRRRNHSNRTQVA